MNTVNGALKPNIREFSRPQFMSHESAFLAIAADLPFENWLAENFLIELPQKWSLSATAWLDNIPVGYAIVSAKTSQRAHLHHLMLALEQRGSGIGQSLLDDVEDRARKNRYSQFSVRVDANNDKALRFYHRNHFVEITTHNQYIELLKQL
jgi:ribosomal protein S18 acetylase RimI-like enzyme